VSAELRLWVTPRAASDRVGPFTDGVLSVRVTRPAAGGEANRAALRVVARALDLPVSALQLTAGGAARHKRLLVEGLDSAEMLRRLERLRD
jgi:uncharacterized protein YggU (UPF0235/DUF167 family)